MPTDADSAPTATTAASDATGATADEPAAAPAPTTPDGDPTRAALDLRLPEPGDRTWHAPDGRVLFADNPKRRAPTINPDP